MISHNRMTSIIHLYFLFFFYIDLRIHNTVQKRVVPIIIFIKFESSIKIIFQI